MPLAWTTILIIAFLLPGVFIFIGININERYSKEIVRSGAVGEVGLAIFLAVIIHIAANLIAWPLGIHAASFITPIIEAADSDHHTAFKAAFDSLPACLIYLIITALMGLGIGWLVGYGILHGPLRFLATHRWVYDVIKNNSSASGFVTAYVMTKTVIKDRVVMYKGKLGEFYLTLDGKFAYLNLENASKFSMTTEDAALPTSDQLPLFAHQATEVVGPWNYLKIDGDNIANVVFDRTPFVIATKEGEERLKRGLELNKLYQQRKLEKRREAIAELDRQISQLQKEIEGTRRKN